MNSVNDQLCNRILRILTKTQIFEMDVSRDVRYFLQICFFFNFEAIYSRESSFLIASEMCSIRLEILRVEIPRRKYEKIFYIGPDPKLNFHNLQFWNAVYSVDLLKMNRCGPFQKDNNSEVATVAVSSNPSSLIQVPR